MGYDLLSERWITAKGRKPVCSSCSRLLAAARLQEERKGVREKHEGGWKAAVCSAAQVPRSYGEKRLRARPGRPKPVVNILVGRTPAAAPQPLTSLVNISNHFSIPTNKICHQDTRGRRRRIYTQPPNAPPLAANPSTAPRLLQLFINVL